MIRLEMEHKVVSEANSRGHWRARYLRTKATREVVFLGLQTCGQPPPPAPLVVVLTRLAPRKLDCDNNQSAFKATRDAVAQWIGIDDGDDRIKWEYAQEQVSKRYAIRIEISTAAEFAKAARVDAEGLTAADLALDPADVATMRGTDR